MKECPQCHRRYDDSMNFCTYDGQQLNPVVAESVERELQQSNLIPKHKSELGPEAKKGGFPKWLFGAIVGFTGALLFMYFNNKQNSNTQYIEEPIVESEITTKNVPINEANHVEIETNIVPKTANVTTSKRNGAINGHEWADLGLSVKWATCNVGANIPEAFGSYFAWGETNAKNEYTCANMRYCTGGNDYSNLTFSKYVGDSEHGPVDNKFTLELRDDAAYANWGGTWRMPTKEEFQELVDNCTWIWTAVNGIDGYKIVSDLNGNSIFLPAAGERSSETAFKVGDNNGGNFGYYWSSSLVENDSCYSRYLAFNSNFFNMASSFRPIGHSVRPVCH